MIVRPDAVWSDPITLTAPVMFQCQAGTVFLAILSAGDTPASDDDGLILVQDPMRPLRDSVIVPEGKDVRWRAANDRPTKLYYAEL